MDGKESEAAERVRPDNSSRNRERWLWWLHTAVSVVNAAVPGCDRLTSLLESGAVKRVRLDDYQRDGGDGNEPETVETGRPGEQQQQQQQGAGNDKVKRVRLDDNQRDGGDGNESETVETGRPGEQQQQGAGNDKEPSGDDRQRRARKVKGVGLSSSGRHYRRHRDDPEWRAKQATKRAQREPPKPIDPQRMPTLVKLLDVVLEVEPWNTERHGKNTGRAWAECGERVPAYLENSRSRPHEFVRQNTFRMARQLHAPNSHAARAWSPEVKQRVGALADKLTADPRYRDKFTRTTEDPTHGKPGTPQQQQQERERGDPEGTVASV